MAVVNGEPGFTQLTKLNVTDTLAVNGIPQGAVVLNATSFSAQAPSAVDTPIQVEFGAAQGTAADPLQIDNLGTVFVNADGTYLITALFSYERAGASGEAIGFFRVLINDSAAGFNPVAVSEDDNESTTPLQFNLELQLNAGDTVKAEFYRDSAGVNEGSLVGRTSAIGWGQSASANVRITKI